MDRQRAAGDDAPAVYIRLMTRSGIACILMSGAVVLYMSVFDHEDVGIMCGCLVLVGVIIPTSEP